ncbi:MAG: hypothetical protein V4555_10395 [Acidobacteriota bacterium]
MIPFLRSIARTLERRVLLIACLLTLYIAFVPFARVFFNLEVDYDEGWNVYNADRVAHQLLYPVRYGWTTVNYPPISFYLYAKLHHLTHDYLFTARAVSLLSILTCSFLVAAIVHALGASRRMSFLAGCFCLATFCAAADCYVGMDDPQLLSHVFFLLGLLIYIRVRESSHRIVGLAAAALIFIIATFIKQNPIDFPAAALIDLAFLSLPLALWFALCCAAFTAIATALAIHFGGHFFLAEFFMPRSYSTLTLLGQVGGYFGPLLIPFAVAVFTAWKLRHDPRRRIASIFLVISFSLGSYFSGGSGVSINALFSATFAMVILIGLSAEPRAASPWLSRIPQPIAQVALFLWLLIPLGLAGHLNPILDLRDLTQQQRAFQQDVAFLRNHPGPALCESLLECYSAGKPFLYDPFNATRLIRLGKLDRNVLIDELRRQQFSVIQFDALTNGSPDPERFDPLISQAIFRNYTPVGGAGGTILYAPQTSLAH